METEKSHGEWYSGIAGEIGRLKETLTPGEYRRYRLDMLLCVAERVEEFAPECGECQLYQQEISGLAQDAGSLVRLNDRERRKAHLKALKAITHHLQNQHKLVPEGYYMGVFTAIGVAIGAGLGVVTHFAGTGVGIALGAGIGAMLDTKAKNEGRVLCPRKTSQSQTKTKMVLVIILIGLMAAGALAYIFFTRYS